MNGDLKKFRSPTISPNKKDNSFITKKLKKNKKFENENEKDFNNC